jgi:hypothetical protein
VNFEAAKEFSMSPNTYLWQDIRRVASDVSREGADELLSLIHTFGLLVMVWAFEAFLTERCLELAGDLAEPLVDRCGTPISLEDASWRRKLRALAPRHRTPNEWESYIKQHYTPEMYFRARQLWTHATGLARAVRPENRPCPEEISTTPDPLDDLPGGEENYYADSQGRLWVRRKLWRGCVNALSAIVSECR